MEIKNIFESIPSELEEEYFEEILSSKNFKMERIVSDGHSSPKDFWYDQDEHEFVILISGSAEIEFENEPSVKLKPGDYLIIPAHKKHRVERSDEIEKTFWLALHY